MLITIYVLISVIYKKIFKINDETTITVNTNKIIDNPKQINNILEERDDKKNFKIND